MNGTLLWGKGMSVHKHCATVFIGELFEAEKSSSAPGIKDAVPKKKS